MPDTPPPDKPLGDAVAAIIATARKNETAARICAALDLDPDMTVGEFGRRYKLGCYVADTNDNADAHGPFRRWVTNMLAKAAVKVTS